MIDCGVAIRCGKLYIVIYSVLFTWTVSLSAQSLSFSQFVTDTNPSEDTPFSFVFDISCNSTTGDCQDVVISGYLPDALDFLNFSDPLPSGVAGASYDPWTRQYTITFNQGDGNDLSQGSSIQISLQVKFPVSTPSGRTVTNSAVANGTNVGSANSSATTTVSGGWTPGDFSEEKIGDNEQLAGGYQYYQIRTGNIGFGPIDSYEVIDVLPSEFTLDQIRTPHYPYVNHPGSLYYMRSDNPGVWVNWVNFNLNARVTRYVSDLSLPAGVKITQLRLSLGTLDGDGLYNPYRYIEGFESSLVIYGYIDNGLPDGYSITNCADYSGTTVGTPISGQACHTMSINSSLSVDRPYGYVEFIEDDGSYITVANIGDTVKALFTYYSDPFMSVDILGGVMTVILPPNMQYLSGSLMESWTCNAFDGMSPVIQTGTLFDGREYFRMVYDDSFGNEFNIEANGFWDGCGFEIEVFIPPGSSEGIQTIEYYYHATGSSHVECTDADVNNYLNGYSFSGNYCYASNILSVVQAPGSAGVQSKKEVIGTLDSFYSQYPATGTTVPGGLSNYQISLTNPNATPINNIRLYDILPHIGDTEILDPSTPRSSQWQPNLAAPITAPAGVTVYYSTTTNPCRDDLAGTNTTPFPAGCTPPAWSSVPPADITDVRSLFFDLWGITLNQSESITLDIEMRAPVIAPTSGEVSWNSFAYAADNATTGNPLLPSEPIKVGIQTIPGTVPIVGDFVWDDLNGNGLQDVGEPGIDGVRVGLYKDTDGDGLEEPYTDDTEYSWTITANGGQYIFSDFPTGDYFLVFSNFPSGYVATHKDVGSNAALDSDGPVTDIISFASTTDERDVDFGLFNGVLPPLWICNTVLLNNNEFEFGFTSWVDWGSTSLTSDSYVGSNAMLINGAQGGRGQARSVNPGETYKLSFYAKKTSSEEAYGGINFKDVNNNTIYELSRQVFENVYEYHSVTVTAPAGAVAMEVYGFKHAGVGAAYFDAFCLEKVNDVCSWSSIDICTSFNPSNNIVSNPGFENAGSLVFSTTFEGNPAAPLANSSSDLPDWIMDFLGCPCPDAYLIDDSADLVNNPEGDKFLWVPVLSNCVRGVVNVVEGRCYEISVDMAAWSEPDPQDQSSMRIEMFGGGISGPGGTLDVLYSALVPPSPSWNNLNWQTYTFTWQAPMTTSTSIFFTQSDSLGTEKGLAIDNVRMTPICCNPVEICNNGIDDDSDGLIDCSDTVDCHNFISCNDFDADGVCKNYDIDDDNDGIKDIDEGICNGNLGGWVQWHHNDPANTGAPDIYALTYVNSADNEVFGSGLGAYLDATLIKMTGIDQSDLASAYADSDYIEYSFTSASDINSAYIASFGHTKHGLGVASPDNYGYDFSILVSDDSFITHQIISDISTVDPNINPSWTSPTNEADDNYYVILPNTEYTFRVYFFNKTTNPNVEAFYDDFIINVEYCGLPADVDGDGVINANDLDSDNDGLSDHVEAGHNLNDANLDGIIDGAETNSGINGLFNPLETTTDNGIINYSISDSEASPDGIFDPYELDSDGDGCYDTVEALVSEVNDADGFAGPNPPTVDANGRVVGQSYNTPTSNWWQDHLYNYCQICRTATTNPHIMYYRRR